MYSLNIAHDQKEHFEVKVPFKNAAIRYERDWDLIICPTAVNQRELEEFCSLETCQEKKKIPLTLEFLVALLCMI